MFYLRWHNDRGVRRAMITRANQPFSHSLARPSGPVRINEVTHATRDQGWGEAVGKIEES